MRSILRILVLAAIFAGLGSCAVGTTGGPQPASMTAARAGLLPEYRIFYDTLQDYGDWVLVEPYGYLFRPRIGFHDWRPYEYGFWAPTDAYGWVWISNEPFGWATYHYGRWFFDDFDGWLWQPGVQWAPAWVGWQANDQYVGWTPMFDGGGRGAPPGGSYLFAPVSAMGSTDLSANIKTAGELGPAVADARPVSETVEVEGKRVPAGPPIARIERLAGVTLPRAKIDDLLQRTALGERGSRAGSTPAAAPTLDEMRRAAEQASREARALSSRGGRAPLHLLMVRPVVQRGLAPRPLPAAVDSLARRPGG